MSDKPTARIIAFKPPQTDYQLQCPDCDSYSFELVMKDVKQGLSVSTINCANPDCTYYTLATLDMGDEHYQS